MFIIMLVFRILVAGDHPEGRSWHSFTPITDSHIFMYGGYSDQGVPLGKYSSTSPFNILKFDSIPGFN